MYWPRIRRSFYSRCLVKNTKAKKAVTPTICRANNEEREREKERLRDKVIRDTGRVEYSLIEAKIEAFSF